MLLAKVQSNCVSNEADMIVCLKHISVNPVYEGPRLVSFILRILCCFYAQTVVEVNEQQRGINPLGQFCCGSSPPFCSYRCFVEEPR